MPKDLILQWFLETQVPLISQDGSFPEWFHGFLTRTQTENLLKDKGFGHFLIRLNERSFGYILSYRGKDRCRHFVVSCQRNGHYVVSGDTRTHRSLADLICYYQTSEIEPFGENLTVACTKLEEKGIYDEISLDQQTSLKQNSAAADPALTGEAFRSPSAPGPAKEKRSLQAPELRKTLPGQQKSSAEKEQALRPEDPDEAPPVPDRSRSLAPESSEMGLDVERSIVYAALKKFHLDNRGVGHRTGPGRTFRDHLQAPEDPGRVSPSSYKSKVSAVFAWTKPSDTEHSKKVNQIGTLPPKTIYAEIHPDQGKSCLTVPSLPSGQSSRTPSKKATRSSPTSTPLKVSPALATKQKSSTELQGPQSLFPASPVVGEGHQNKALHGGAPYGQISKMKSHPTTACPSNERSHEQASFGWLRSVTHKLDSEKSPKTSPATSKETYNQISARTEWPPKPQPHTKDPYEKIPSHFSQGSLAARRVPTAENTYERISFGLRTVPEAKPSQKSDKPRKFLFADKTTKF